MDENDLDRFITNDVDPDGYQVFIGTKKMGETKFNIKKYVLGLLSLSYSRLVLDNIINASYGEDRFNNNIIDKQIYYGDTESVLLNVDIAKKLQKAGFIGVNNGELTDDLNKNFEKIILKIKIIMNFIKLLITVQQLLKNTQ